MAQQTVKIRMKKGNIVEMPKDNLANFKRLFFTQIDYVEEQEDEPIILKPVMQEITPIIEEVNPIATEPIADSSMTKKELQELAKDIEGYDPSMKKDELIELINK